MKRYGFVIRRDCAGGRRTAGMRVGGTLKAVRPSLRPYDAHPGRSASTPPAKLAYYGSDFRTTRRHSYSYSRTSGNGHSHALRGSGTQNPYGRHTEIRPHGHGHYFPVRPADAFQSQRQLPTAHHEDGVLQRTRLRAAVVPQRLHERTLAAGAQRAHLGRMGRRERRFGAGRRRAVA